MMVDYQDSTPRAGEFTKVKHMACRCQATLALLTDFSNSEFYVVFCLPVNHIFSALVYNGNHKDPSHFP
jgi:hypothetical protein